MHHSATKDFKPAGILADLASFATTHETFHIHLRRRFCEREVRCAETRAHILPKHPARKIDQRSLQVCERDVLPHHKPLHLVELDLRTCGYLLITETHSGQRNANWWRVIRIHRRV